MNEREFVLQYQANLIVKEFLKYRSREKKRAFFLIPKIQHADFDSNGITITCKSIVSNRMAYRPSTTDLPSWNRYNICDRYYGEIISQHTNLDGTDSEYHQRHIAYVQNEDQEMLCNLIYQKFYENHINGVKVYFERATEKKFIFQRDLGYSYLCISYFE